MPFVIPKCVFMKILHFYFTLLWFLETWLGGNHQNDKQMKRTIRQNTAQRFVILADRILKLWKVVTAAALLSFVTPIARLSVEIWHSCHKVSQQE